MSATFSNELLSVGDVVAASVPYEQHQRPQIYFLISEGRVVYVGKSCQTNYRLSVHTLDGKKFDRVTVIDCESVEQMDRLEWHYIVKFEPPLNKVLPCMPGVVALDKTRKDLGITQKAIQRLLAEGQIKLLLGGRLGTWISEADAAVLAGYAGARK